MDLSLGAAVDWADVSPGGGPGLDGHSHRGRLRGAAGDARIDLVGHAGAVKILELHAAGRCDGIISWAGSVGTTTATRVMRALPFGVPKVMLTDMASSDVSMWLGNKDIYIVNPDRRTGDQRRHAQGGGERGRGRRRDGPGARDPDRLQTAGRDHVLRHHDADGPAMRCVHGGQGLGCQRLPRRGRRSHDGGPDPIRLDHGDHRHHARASS